MLAQSKCQVIELGDHFNVPYALENIVSTLSSDRALGGVGAVDCHFEDMAAESECLLFTRGHRAGELQSLGLNQESYFRAWFPTIALSSQVLISFSGLDLPLDPNMGTGRWYLLSICHINIPP